MKKLEYKVGDWFVERCKMDYHYRKRKIGDIYSIFYILKNFGGGIVLVKYFWCLEKPFIHANSFNFDDYSDCMEKLEEP